jgi:hypothetical protein
MTMRYPQGAVVARCPLCEKPVASFIDPGGSLTVLVRLPTPEGLVVSWIHWDCLATAAPYLYRLLYDPQAAAMAKIAEARVAQGRPADVRLN